MSRMRWMWGLLLMLLLPVLGQAQQCTQAQLNTEFMTDPTARAYSTCAGAGGLGGANVNDQCVLDKFNAPCTNNAACKVDQTVTREAIYEVINPTEFETLARATTANEVARMKQLDTAMRQTTFNLAKGDVRQKLFNIFTNPASPITNAAIAALQQKDVPRSQIVCNRPGTLTDVSCGLRGAC